MLLFFVWDFSKTAFIIPYCCVPIYWYSLFFSVGILGSLLIAKKLFRDRARVLGYIAASEIAAINNFADRLFCYLFIGLLTGARLGHVLFYDIDYYSSHLIEIANIRQGGLSSHGSVIGLLIALYFFQKKELHIPFVLKGRDILDALTICSGWAAFCIRCGNFFNQEIIGTASTLPWAVIFTQPVEGASGIPRHPTQLYEALVSLVLLGVFLFIGRGGRWASDGKIAGFYLLITFAARIFIEIFKAPQCTMDCNWLHMGQLLSIPVIAFAIYLIISAREGK